MADPVVDERNAVRAGQAPDKAPVQPQFVGVRPVLILPCHVVPFRVRNTAGIYVSINDALGVLPRPEPLPAMACRRKGNAGRKGATVRRVMR